MTGPCRRCGAPDATVTPYWATDGHKLCEACCITVAKKWDADNRWPDVPWTADDRKVLADG